MSGLVTRPIDLSSEDSKVLANVERLPKDHVSPSRWFGDLLVHSC